MSRDTVTRHTFAFYKENLSNALSDGGMAELFAQWVTAVGMAELFFKSCRAQKIVSRDKSLHDRLVKITRVRAGETFILFDEKINITISANQEMLDSKEIVSGEIMEVQENKQLKPKITLYLPILKKEALEHAAYVAAQMGVATIVPVVTKKSLKILSDKEVLRLKKIMIGACEQSKQFIRPLIETTVDLEQANFSNLLICLDEHGDKINRWIKSTCRPDEHRPISLLLGPEGGLDTQEKIFLKEKGFSFIKLTPTVLRAKEAVTVGLGLLRTIL